MGGFEVFPFSEMEVTSVPRARRRGRVSRLEIRAEKISSAAKPAFAPARRRMGGTATHSLTVKYVTVPLLGAGSPTGDEGLALSRNDKRDVLFGQLLTTIGSVSEIGEIIEAVESTLTGSADVRD